MVGSHAWVGAMVGSHAWVRAMVGSHAWVGAMVGSHAWVGAMVGIRTKIYRIFFEFSKEFCPNFFGRRAEDTQGRAN